jgi:AraC-like DNA-binding protein
MRQLPVSFVIFFIQIYRRPTAENCKKSLILKVERHIPAATLQPFIKDYLFIENESEMDNRILPDTSVVLSVRYRGHISLQENNLPDVVLSGIRRSPKNIHYGGQSGNLLVRFTPGGAAAFFSEPLNEWADQTVPASFLKRYSDIRQLPERLAECSAKEEKIAQLERVLMPKLINAQPDPLILFAIQKICSAGGLLPIRQLTRELYISQDAFEKRFRQTVGASPKQFSTIIRFRNAIGTHSVTSNLTETAHAAGYYDQAHFIKAFKSFAGQSPGQFFRDRRY